MRYINIFLMHVRSLSYYHLIKYRLNVCVIKYDKISNVILICYQQLYYNSYNYSEIMKLSPTYRYDQHVPVHRDELRYPCNFVSDNHHHCFMKSPSNNTILLMNALLSSFRQIKSTMQYLICYRQIYFLPVYFVTFQKLRR